MKKAKDNKNNFSGTGIGIIGGAGYTGGELIRILINHPHVTIEFVHSKSNAGKYLYEVHADLVGETTMKFSAKVDWKAVDILFLCVGHGEAKKFLEENDIPEHLRVIDLSQDFRLSANGHLPAINNHPVVYGLPELNK